MVTYGKIQKLTAKVPVGAIKANVSRAKGSIDRARRRASERKMPVRGFRRVAIFWDAENVPARHVSAIMKHAENWGRVTLRKLYGPLGLLANPSFAQVIWEYGFEEVVCNGARAGKNSVDINLVVDAMECAHAGLADDFVIVSGDSDYGPLVRSLRKQGKIVHGAGISGTVSVLRKTCDTWSYVDGFVVSDDAQQKIATQKKAAKPKKKDDPPELTAVLLDTINHAKCDPDGWVSVSGFALVLHKRHPDFDPKKFGSKKISRLLKNAKRFEVRSVNNGYYVRLKP